MIPKLIHQTYRSQRHIDTCPTLKYCQDRLIDLHPDFEYKFYDDDQMSVFVSVNYPEHHHKFSSLPKKIMRVDVFRYLLMHEEGGIYCDCDYLFLRPFSFLDEECLLMEEFTNTKEFRGTNISNCIFASPPKFRFWMDMAEESMNLVHDFTSRNNDITPLDVLRLTGPLFVDSFYRNYPTKTGIKVLESKYFNSDDFGKNDVINSFKSKNGKTDVSTCSLIEDEEVLKMLEKFCSSDHKYGGIHLHTNSWIGTQWHKFMRLFEDVEKTDHRNGNL